MKTIKLENLVCLVTGANKENGIGQALVEKAIQEGAKKVYVTARRLESLSSLQEKHPAKVVPLELDITDKNSIAQVAEQASDTQVLFNNAGSGSFSGLIDNYKEESCEQDFRVNYWGTVHMMQAFAKKIEENKTGAIVNIISVGALYPNPALSGYSASKAALRSATQVARIELHRLGIPVFAVYPGPIQTEMAEAIKGEKETPSTLACRVIEGMKKGELEITTDSFSDAFRTYLEIPKEVLLALKKFKERQS